MDRLTRRGLLAVGAAAAAPALSVRAAGAVAPAHGAQNVPVTTGADVVAAERFKRLAGRRLAVVTNPTGVLRDLTHVVDAMAAAGVPPVAIFGPEHGFRGTAQAGGAQRDYRDPRTRIRVLDAYAASPAKLTALLRRTRAETVVFDIADVGARFYTYIWTMYTAMRAAAAAGASFVVLDRPNPLGGHALGPVLAPRFASGVGRKPIAQQHGMTVGELARLFDDRFLAADAGRRLRSLDVIGVQGWARDDLFASTRLPWVPPSPNMPTADTALVYPGTCLFEGTSFSEGRGTTRPFETIGAPGVDWRWAHRLNTIGLPGVGFRETYFTPTFSKFRARTCGGVQLHVTDPRAFDAIRTAVAMLVTAKRLYRSAFAWRADHWIDLLSGSSRLRHMVDRGAGVDDVVGAWRAELASFRQLRAQYLLYG
jgi:uncharacterized protein YbbC (DUF1343 family)